MDPKNIGYYAGYIMSSFYLGQLIGVLFWGYIADKHGRKIPLCFVVLRNCVPSYWSVVDGISVLCFAFIKNYYLAVGLRFIWGFCDGHYSLIKTLVADYSNEKTLARNSSFMFLSVSIGKSLMMNHVMFSSLAPLVGGYLSNPDNISEWIKRVFPIIRHKRFCFPFILCSVGLLTCLIFLFFSHL